MLFFLHVFDFFVGLTILRQWEEIDQNGQLVSPEKNMPVVMLIPLSTTAKCDWWGHSKRT